MEVVGSTASIWGLIKAAQTIFNVIERSYLNPKQRSRLQEKVHGLIEYLKSAESTSDEAEDFVQSSLQEVESVLESLAEPRNRYLVSKIMLGCIRGGAEEAKLKTVERKLECLRTEVMVVESALKLKKDIPSIFNKRLELPQSHAGLDRAQEVLTFLQTSESKDLRVIGIHGLPGVGKTTLLNYVWQKRSSMAIFAARAYVQIGHSATSQVVCNLQTSVLKQLGGGTKEFSTPEFGKEKLSEHFRQLRVDRKPFFLAIDNVFKAEDLELLLPSSISTETLPVSSCIAVTCRDHRIIEALLTTCDLLKEENRSQVLSFSPPCLGFEDSKRVFAACGDLCLDKDVELLDSLVPLCVGLPLAITLLGKIFAGNANRERKDWEGIMERMRNLDGEEATTMRVRKIVQLSYDHLSKSHQAAFLDVVDFFYGWPWERVERILGKSVLEELKCSTLVSEASSWTECNQSALRAGYTMEWIDDVVVPFTLERVVAMHDSILHFGKCLHTRPKVVTRRDFQSSEGLLGLKAPKLKNLMLWSPYPGGDPELEVLKKATSLQMLHLRATVSFYSILTDAVVQVRPHYYEKNLFKANYQQSFNDGGPLHYLGLSGWNSSRRIMEMKVSSEIREIQLYCCGDVKQLPNTPLHQLEWLSIVGCETFQGFSSLCVENWRKLKHLEVTGCKCITGVPVELGRLKNLRFVQFMMCSRLETFPSLCSAEGPSHLGIEECPSLRTLPTMSCPLQTLGLAGLPITCLTLEEVACESLRKVHLERCPFEELPILLSSAASLEVLSVAACDKLKRLLPAIGNASALQKLSVRGCSSLEELSDEVGRLTSLTELNIFECRNLKMLSPAIGRCLALQRLSIVQCKSLAELPDEMGSLGSLTVLDVSRCSMLRAVPSAIGNVSSLQTLRFGGCSSLEELPSGVRRLTSLTELDVSGWKNLRVLLPALGNDSSLETLRLSGCDSLEGLPDEMRRLTLLTELDISMCKNLGALPPAIGDVSSLRTLMLVGCDNLEELPAEVGKLTSLTTLDVSECRNLRALRLAIGNVSSLRTLILVACDNLEGLPDEVKRLTSLTTLDVSRCKKWRALPPAIGNVLSLQELKCAGCDSLEELPDEVGKLTLLTTLDLSGCKNLRALPPAIGNVSSLQTLKLDECDSLEELPAEVGRLTSLINLNVSGCKNLRALTLASSLRMLTLSGWDSLEELPNEVGWLTSLAELYASNCRNLRALSPAIGKLWSLRKLVLSGCESLEELPDDVENLNSLAELNVSWCKNLRALPPSIAKCSSLETLSVWGCKSLVELPDELVTLALSRKLCVIGCKSLQPLELD